MGTSISSHLVTTISNDEVDIQNRVQETYESHYLFRRWTVEDVQHFISQLSSSSPSLSSSPPSSSSFETKCSWSQLYETTLCIEDGRLRRLEKERRDCSYHPCTDGYAMEKDLDALEDMRQYRLNLEANDNDMNGDDDGASTETAQNLELMDDAYTTDEESEDESESEDEYADTDDENEGAKADNKKSTSIDEEEEEEEGSSSNNNNEGNKDESEGIGSGTINETNPVSDEKTKHVKESLDAGERTGNDNECDTESISNDASDCAESTIADDTATIPPPPPPPPSFDATLCSPIFFGYTYQPLRQAWHEETQKEQDEQMRGDEIMKQKIQQKEHDIEEFTKEAAVRKQKRAEKIRKLQELHDFARQRRETELADLLDSSSEYDANIRDDLIKQHNIDTAAAEIASGAELEKMTKKHESRCAIDDKKRRGLEKDVQRWKSMESTVAPAGRQLERSIGKEIKCCTTLLEKETKGLDEAKEKLDAVQEDFLQTNGKKTKRKRKLDSAQRSLLLFVESSVEEAERRVQRALQELEDQEVLLQRAFRRRKREDEIIPLWRSLISVTNQRPDDMDKEHIDSSSLVELFDFVAAVTILCGDDFVNKLRYFISIFDFDKDEFLSCNELSMFLYRVGLALHVLGYFQSTLDLDEVHSIMLRAFREMGVVDREKGMTCFEARQWIRRSVSQNQCLATLFGIDWKYGEYSTVQMLLTKPIRQYELGVLSISDLKYHNAKSHLVFRPCLDPQRKKTVHRLALAMGADDPTKADYTKFLPRKRRTARRHHVVPLEHGHLANFTNCMHETALMAAQKLQNIFRGRKSRRRAEELAKREAFMEAREQSIEDMLGKVQIEFERNEELTGSAKLKWDATIRIKQAKVLAAGRELSRDEVIQVLMEEARERGRKEIIARFDELAAERKIDLSDKENATPTSNIDEKEYLTRGDTGLIVSEQVITDAKVSVPKSQQKVLHGTNTLAVGSIVQNQPDPCAERSRGESLQEAVIRLGLSDPNPTIDDLLCRIRGINDVMTLLKTKELLLELPSKRLLCQYVLSWKDPNHLLADFKRHFRVSRDTALVLKGLFHVVHSDIEHGVVKDMYSFMCHASDSALSKLCEEKMYKDLKDTKLRVDEFASKMSEIEELTSHEIIANVCKQDLNQIDSKRNTLQQSENELDRLMKLMVLNQSALDEAQRKYDSMLKYKTMLDDEDVVPTILPSDRESWVDRFYAALEYPESNMDETKFKYNEIQRISADFLDAAAKCAAVIVEEMFLPNHMKSIRPIESRVADGRAHEGGRGQQGLRYKYEKHGIRFKVLVDDDGIFDGSDEFAAKVGGHELRGSREFMKCRVDDLRIPLQATLDVYGFRILASALLPIACSTRQGTGAKTSSKNFVLGTNDRGKTVRNKNPTLDSKVAVCAKTLNLARHLVKGENDINACHMYSSVDIRGYKHSDDNFYLINFWRAFPSENPSVTSHLCESPRGMTIFWRMHRPEFVTNYQYEVNPDANTLITAGTAGCEEEINKNRAATKYLVANLFEAFCWRLSMVALSNNELDGYGLDISSEIHRCGINIRHIGLLRTQLLRAITKNGTSIEMPMETHKKSDEELEGSEKWRKIERLLVAEMAVRTMKNLLRIYLRYAAKTSKTAPKSIQTTIVVDFLNIITGSHERSRNFWSEQLFVGIRHRFGKSALEESEREKLFDFTRSLVVYMVRRFNTMLGIKLSNECESHLIDQGCIRFASIDIVSIGQRVKHNIFVKDIADAMVLSCRLKEILLMSYSYQITRDNPAIYLILSERNGSKIVRNNGAIGDIFNGKYSGQEELGCTGPLHLQEDNKSAYFAAKNRCKIEGLICSSSSEGNCQFSVEIWAKVEGGIGTNRTAVMTNMCALVATRLNKWSFAIFLEGKILILDGPDVCNGEWYHLAGTYDGTNAYMYINGKPCAHLDVRLAMISEADVLQQDRQHCAERNVEVEKTEGIDYLDNEDAREIHGERDSFDAVLCDTVRNEQGQDSDQEATLSDFNDCYYSQNKDSVGQTHELHENSISVGSTLKSKRTVDGRNFFEGYLCHVSIYMRALSADDISRHVRSANNEMRVADSTRYYALTDEAFQRAIRQDPSNTKIVKQYIEHMCTSLGIVNILHVDHHDQLKRAKRIVNELTRLQNCDGMAEALKIFPNFEGSANLVCLLYTTIMKVNSKYFQVDSTLPLSDVGMIPFKYSILRKWKVDTDMITIAARIFRQTLSENSLSNLYGDIDLQWAIQLESDRVLVSQVVCAFEGDDERHIDLKKMNCNQEIQDFDLIWIAKNSRMAHTLDLTGCTNITDKSLMEIASSCKFIEVLKLRDCVNISDFCARALEDMNPHLRVLGMENLFIGDQFLLRMANRCEKMTHLNLAGCKEVSDMFMEAAGKSLGNLISMDLSFCTAVTDIGVQNFASTVNLSTFASLNLTCCRSVTDVGISKLSRLKNLMSLRISGLNKCSDKGLQAVIANCLHLKIMHVEDFYRLSDECFNVQSTDDHDKILSNLEELNLRDCSNLTDQAFSHLSRQCKKLSKVIASGINQITDEAISFISQNKNLKSISVEGCLNITDSSPSFLSKSCVSLQEIDLNGCVNITDRGIEELVSKCTNVKIILISRCKRLTDRSLNCIARYLCCVVEEMNVSLCNRITDEGMECVVTACPNLKFLNVSFCKNVSRYAVVQVAKHCKDLKMFYAGPFDSEEEGGEKVSRENDAWNKDGSFYHEVVKLLPDCDFIIKER